MKLRVPNYYKKFECIADKCNDCCCIGWEIDIDTKTSKIYNNISGEFGKKLKSNIKFDKTNSFILDEHERCPFLNNKNLCDIFLNLGEQNLCTICKEHPRYYEWFDGIKEGGIGLCCEEAARIILSNQDSFDTYEIEIPYEKSDNYNPKLYTYLLTARSKIISHLENKLIPFNVRINNTLNYAWQLQNNIDIYNLEPLNIINTSISPSSSIKPILEFFLTLEPFDKNWISYLQNCINLYDKYSIKLNDFENENPDIFNYLQNISVYFIWRYFLKGVFDNDIISKVKLMVISITIIKTLYFCKWLETGVLTLNDCINISKNYSKEIEYSEDNLYAIEDACYELNAFSLDSLLSILR